MSITAKEAYKTAIDVLDGLVIYSCCELSDRFLFSFKNTSGGAVLLPPLCVPKNGDEPSLHDESASAFLNNTCREKGTVIPIEDLQ